MSNNKTINNKNRMRMRIKSKNQLLKKTFLKHSSMYMSQKLSASLRCTSGRYLVSEHSQLSLLFTNQFCLKTHQIVPWPITLMSKRDRLIKKEKGQSLSNTKISKGKRKLGMVKNLSMRSVNGRRSKLLTSSLNKRSLSCAWILLVKMLRSLTRKSALSCKLLIDLEIFGKKKSVIVSKLISNGNLDYSMLILKLSQKLSKL